jgi:hypothetical protein
MDKVQRKTEVRRFARWARESLRELEAALRADDLDEAIQMAAEASGFCGEAENILRDQAGQVAID